MHFAVCIKQVPDTAEVKIDPETNTLVRAGVESMANPYDIIAMEEALRLKEKYGARVTADIDGASTGGFRTQAGAFDGRRRRDSCSPTALLPARTPWPRATRFQRPLRRWEVLNRWIWSCVGNKPSMGIRRKPAPALP